MTGRQLDPPDFPVNVPIRTWSRLSNYLTPDERLDPGGSAKALLGRYTETAGYVFQDNVAPINTGQSEVTIYDPMGVNFRIPGEDTPVIWEPRSKRWEIDGSWGLRRQCKVTDSYAIAWLSAGDVALWCNRALISPTQTLTAHFKWMGQTGDTINIGVEAWIEYVPCAARWEFIQIGCP